MRLLTAGLQVRVLLAELEASLLNQGSLTAWMPHTLYILRSISSPRYYVGVTSDLTLRMEFHNNLGKGFTARYRPWEVVFTRMYELKSEALSAERRIKGWKSRKMIDRLLRGEVSV